ncbi:AAA family ATPase [Micromonospora sp. WMMA1923]|uniref:AAA family ATPase n=1 Tax=Micromonospora sp. WMMA1923 TaxID=3404125 RepID=UPI003B95A8BE
MFDLGQPRSAPSSLAGRCRELQLFTARLDALTAVEPVGGVLLVAGARGLGRTALLGAYAELARDRGHRLRSVAISVRGAHRPYAPVVEAFEDDLADRPELTAGLDPVTRRTLAGVFPRLATDGPVAVPAPYDAASALRTLCGRLTADRPLVLLFDDVQRADPATVALLHELLRRPPRAPVLTVLTYHRRRSGAPFGAVPTTSGTAPTSVTHVELAPLGPDDVAALGRGRVCGRHLRSAPALSGGNPALLREYWRNCTGEPYCPVVPWWSQPDAVPPAEFCAELETLTPGARSVARAAAVLGNDADVELVTALSRLASADALTGLDELVDAGFLEAGRGVGTFRFVHPALLAAVYRSTPQGWLLAAHELAADLLRHRGAPVQAYADHVERGASVASVAAAEVLIAAARAVAGTDNDRALRWYVAAERMLPADPEGDRRRRPLLTALARCQLRAADLAAVRSVLDRRDALAGTTTTDRVEQARVAGIRADLAMLAGSPLEAQDLLIRALRTAPAHDGGAHSARLRVALSVAGAFEAGPLENAPPWCEDAIVAAVGSGSRVLQAQALAVNAVVRLAARVPGAAVRSADECGQLVGRLSADELAGRPALLGWLGWADLLLERPASAHDRLNRCLLVAGPSGDVPAQVAALCGLALLAVRESRLDDAAGLAARALALADRTDSTLLAAMAAVVRAEVALERDELDQALELTGTSPVDAVVNSAWWHRAQLVRAEAQLRAGDADACRLLVLESGGGEDLVRLPAFEQARAFGLLARAGAARGQDAAPIWAKRACVVATELGLPEQIALAQLVLVEVNGSHAEEPHLLARRLGAQGGSGCRATAVRACLLAARRYLGVGSTSAADAELHHAADLVARLGSPAHLVAAVESARAEVAVEMPPTAAGHLGLLSPRESEIACLVARGLTNRQIARLLTLSPKTVETHLGRIFVKLAVSSRAEIAHLVGRAGAVTHDVPGRTA